MLSSLNRLRTGDRKRAYRMTDGGQAYFRLSSGLILSVGVYLSLRLETQNRRNGVCKVANLQPEFRLVNRASGID